MFKCSWSTLLVSELSEPVIGIFSTMNFMMKNGERCPMEMINLSKTKTDKAHAFREELRKWVRTNLKEGEIDPVVYKDCGELHKECLNIVKR